MDYLNSDYNGKNVVFWTQPSSELVEKLNECMLLKAYVIKYFNEIMEKMTEEGFGTFKILYNTTFGNFFLFFERLDKVSE